MYLCNSERKHHLTVASVLLSPMFAAADRDGSAFIRRRAAARRSSQHRHGTHHARECASTWLPCCMCHTSGIPFCVVSSTAGHANPCQQPGTPLTMVLLCQIRSAFCTSVVQSHEMCDLSDVSFMM